jgi:uncharacterized phage protein (TIGR01671 family)
MNRELKFRCWDKINKKFVSPSHIAINGNGILLITDSGMYEKLQNKNYCNVDQEYVVQQYTGLYDNNKKPIYESDRVRFGYSESHDFFGEVIYLEDRASFGVRYKNTFETLEDVPMDHMKYFEVIGNIFEVENKETTCPV